MSKRLNQGDQLGHRGRRQLGRRPSGRHEGGAGQAKPMAVAVVDQDIGNPRVLVRQGGAAKAPTEERMRRIEDDDLVVG